MERFLEPLCPECSKHWESTPSALPDPDESFDCPDCGERRRPSEFTPTAWDLEVLPEELS
jgi:tRNA(Ile2) C34 agmatinyltransferase TiaS